MENNMIKRISAMKARQNLGSLMNSISLKGDEVIIERAGKPMVAMIPVKRFLELTKQKLKLEMSEDLPMAEINTNSESFDFLEDEPDLYSIDDLRKRYV